MIIADLQKSDGSSTRHMSGQLHHFQPISSPKDNHPSTGRGRRLLGLAWKLFILPISITGGGIRLVTGSIGLGFWVAGVLLSYSLSMIGIKLPTSVINQESRSIPSVSELEAIDFLSEFESRYGKTHPNFVREGFTEAVQRSRREFKLLLVYLHSPEHPDTPSFCKETLCSEAVSDFVNRNFVPWGDSVRANEGIKMSKSFKASKFPFWAVIMAAAGQTISLLRQFEGPSSAEEMLKELQNVLEESRQALDAARLDTHEHGDNARKEEDAALESDQANEQQSQLEKEAVKDENEAALAKLCEEKALLLGPEPDKGPDVTQVLVRLPNGERKGRRFHCTSTLQSLYDFVDSSGCLEVGSYTLVTFFPRVLYGQDDFSSTLEELGLYPQASLFVELKT